MRQRVLGSTVVMSLVLLPRVGPGVSSCPAPQLFCNSCWTRLEEKCKKPGMREKGRGLWVRAQPLGQADFGPATWEQGEERRLERPASWR